MVEKTTEVVIGATLTNAFKSVFKDAKTKVKDLGASIKTLERSSVAANKLSVLKGKTSAAKNEFDKASKNLKKLETRLASTEQHTDQMVDEWVHAQTVFDKSKIKLEKLTRQTKTADTAARKYGVDTRNLAMEQKRLGAALDQTTRKQDRLNKSMKRSESFKKMGTKARNFGLGAGAAAAGGVLAIRGLTNTVLQEDAAIGGLKTVGIKNIELVKEAARKASVQIAGLSSPGFLLSAYDIKSGISTLTDEGVAAVTLASAKLAKATKGAPEEISSLMAQSFNIFGRELADNGFDEEQVSNVIGGLVANTVKNFRTEGGKIKMALQNLGSSASTAGFDVSQQFAVIGALSNTMEGSMAATKFKALVKELTKANTELKGMNAGFTLFDKEGNVRNIANIVKDFTVATADMTKEESLEFFGNVFSSQEAQDAIATLVEFEKTNKGVFQEVVKGNNDMASSSENATKFLNNMFEAMQDNRDAKLKLFGQSIGEIGSIIGDEMTTALTQLASLFTPVITATTSFLKNNKDIAKYIAWTVLGFTALTGVFAVVSIVAWGLFGILSLIGGLMAGGAIAAGAAVIGSAFAAIMPVLGGIVVAGLAIYKTFKLLKSIGHGVKWLFGQTDEQKQDRIDDARQKRSGRASGSLKSFSSEANADTVSSDMSKVSTVSVNAAKESSSKLDSFIMNSPIEITIQGNADAKEVADKVKAGIIDSFTKIEQKVRGNYMVGG